MPGFIARKGARQLFFNTFRIIFARNAAIITPWAVYAPRDEAKVWKKQTIMKKRYQGALDVVTKHCYIGIGRTPPTCCVTYAKTRANRNNPRPRSLVSRTRALIGASVTLHAVCRQSRQSAIQSTVPERILIDVLQTVLLELAHAMINLGKRHLTRLKR
jgi:hypothetical protein